MSVSQPSDDFEIRFANESELEECGRVAAHAFADNPSYQFVFHHLPAEQRQAALAWFLHRRFWVLLQTQGRVCCAVQKSTGRVVATTAFGFSGVMPSLWQRIRAGWLLLPVWYGMATISNIDALVAVMDAHRRRVLFSEKETETETPPVGTPLTRHSDGRAIVDVMMVTVDPSLQKSGIGSRVLRFALAEIERLCANEPSWIVLDTQKEYAAAWYQKTGGFTLRDSSTLMPTERSEHAFRNWVLQRETGSPTNKH
jgi:GNAT superfamily N-acetyltransferase